VKEKPATQGGARAGAPPANFPPADARALKPTPPAPPATFRLPRPGCRCPFFGLSRTEYYDAIKRGAIKSYTLKKPGRGRGIRLIDFASVLAFVTTQTEAQ
jgi:hypothetical protein